MVDYSFLASSTFPTLPPEFVEALQQPFAPNAVRLRAGKRQRSAAEKGWECIAIPVLTRQAVEARLDALVPGGWSTSSPSLVVAHDRVTVSARMTIGVVMHTDYGEVSLTRPAVPDEVEELLWSVPEAFEHALFRVCTRFGLGRYLADLAREWVAYDAERGSIALSPTQRQAHILKLYRQANLALPPEAGQSLISSQVEPAQAFTPKRPEGEATSQGAHRSSSPFAAATRESLRARDITWIQQQCASHPKSLQSILRRWNVPCLEDLSDEQLIDVINSIHRSHARSARALPHVS